MKRTVLFLAAGGLALWAQAASVQASDRTITLYAGAEGEMFVVAQRAVGGTSLGDMQGVKERSDKDHYAIGDRLVFSSPLYSTKDHKSGDTPVATFYGEATVVKGDTYANMLTMLHFDFLFNNGDHITGQGVVDWTRGERHAPITGGTGAYEGARGIVNHPNRIYHLVYQTLK